MNRIYLDYAATAPLRAEVADAMDACRGALWANPNSLHSEGRAAFAELEGCRARIAHALGAHGASEVVLTSGGTESDNTALHGIVDAVMTRRRGQSAHVVVSSIEHHAVLEAAAALSSAGHEVTRVDPRADGFIHPEDLAAALRDDTVLVSVMMANNEVGTVQPVAELAHLAHDRGALFHTDGVQMLGKAPFDLEASGVDAASFSAHKLGGPRGCGVLYLRRGTPFTPYLRGGGQESGKRSGTQDVLGAVGTACAFELAVTELGAESAHLAVLRDRLAERLAAASPRVHVIAPASEQGPIGSDGMPLAGCGAAAPAHLPNIVTVCVERAESELLLMRMDAAGVAVSGGSACSSKSLAPSHVLTAMGVHRDLALGQIRFSLGHGTTEQDIDRAAEAFSAALA